MVRCSLVATSYSAMALPGRYCLNMARDGRSDRDVAQLGKSLSSSAFEEERAMGSLDPAWDEAGSLTRAEMRRRLSPSSAPKAPQHPPVQRHGFPYTSVDAPASAMRLCWIAT